MSDQTTINRESTNDPARPAQVVTRETVTTHHSDEEAGGAVTGGIAGAAVGAVVGGPVGAVVGGAIGAASGATAGLVDEETKPDKETTTEEVVTR